MALKVKSIYILKGVSLDLDIKQRPCCALMLVVENMDII
jgi:hypothetical protein